MLACMGLGERKELLPERASLTRWKYRSPSKAGKAI